MTYQKQVSSSRWAWFLIAIGILCFILRIDPIGAIAARFFGEWARKWATDCVMVILVVWILIRARKKK